MAAYEAATGEERAAALVAYEAALTAEAHAYALWQGLPTPTPRPRPSPTAEPVATATPTPTPRRLAPLRYAGSYPRARRPPTPTAGGPTPTPGPAPPYAAVWTGLANAVWLQQNHPALAVGDYGTSHGSPTASTAPNAMAYKGWSTSQRSTGRSSTLL